MSGARGPAAVVQEWVSRFNQADSDGLDVPNAWLGRPSPR